MHSKLSNDINANTWLIRSADIAQRRLLRQTPRFNVFKANWHGDVLVYQRRRRASFKSHCLDASGTHQTTASCYLGTKLAPVMRLAADKDDSLFDSDSESGYASSNSSTPTYNTKSLHKREFEFPSACERSCIDAAASSSSQARLASSLGASLTSVSQSEPQANLLCLNKDSFKVSKMIADGCCCNKDLSEDEHEHEDDGDDGDYSDEGYNEEAAVKQSDLFASCDDASICWSEVNELRLIAHENFLLFLGATLNDDAGKQWLGRKRAASSNALIMQDCMQNSVSLSEVLHDKKPSVWQARSPSPPSYLHSDNSSRFTFFGNNNKFKGLSIFQKLAICKQVTNAMTYLHDKNIVHGKLTSTNVNLEPNNRIKISLIDSSSIVCKQTTTITTCCTPTEATKTTISDSSSKNALVPIRRESLTYLSPELIKTMRVTNDSSRTTLQFEAQKLTKQLDVYSYGTLLFELFEERFPFSEPSLTANESLRRACSNTIKYSANELIFLIGNGLIAEKNGIKPETGHFNNPTTNKALVAQTLKCPAMIESTIASCWTHNPIERPSFKQLSK